MHCEADVALVIARPDGPLHGLEGPAPLLPPERDGGGDGGWPDGADEGGPAAGRGNCCERFSGGTGHLRYLEGYCQGLSRRGIGAKRLVRRGLTAKQCQALTQQREPAV